VFIIIIIMPFIQNGTAIVEVAVVWMCLYIRCGFNSDATTRVVHTGTSIAGLSIMIMIQSQPATDLGYASSLTVIIRKTDRYMLQLAFSPQTLKFQCILTFTAGIETTKRILAIIMQRSVT
jgi:hypothetical protein